MSESPYCKKHKIPLMFDDFASMGSFHSNYWRCDKCNKVIKLYDISLDRRKYFNMNKDYGLND